MQKRFPAVQLKNLVVELSCAAGVSREDAALFANALIDADLHGASTHGISRLAIYLNRMEKGLIDPKAQLFIDRRVGSALALDAANGLGQVQATKAVDMLMPIAKPHPPTVCNSMWALTDFTEENGATRIIPGTHVADTSPNCGQHYDSIPAEMPRGGVLIWHGSLWHGGGANQTGERRIGIAMNYCAGYIRQQENQQLGLAPSLVKTFPPRLQELVGYGIYNGLIGHIDKHSPAELLSGEGLSAMVWDAV